MADIPDDEVLPPEPIPVDPPAQVTAADAKIDFSFPGSVLGSGLETADPLYKEQEDVVGPPPIVAPPPIQTPTGLAGTWATPLYPGTMIPFRSPDFNEQTIPVTTADDYLASPKKRGRRPVR